MIFFTIASPRPGALFPRGHVGLDQPQPVFLRQTDPVVGTSIHTAPFFDVTETSIWPLLFGMFLQPGFDRFGGVLDQIGNRLCHQPSVYIDDHRLCRWFETEYDV